MNEPLDKGESRTDRHRLIGAASLRLAVTAFPLWRVSEYESANHRVTNLFATTALEGISFCLLLRSAKRVVQVFLGNLPIGSLSLSGGHFLTNRVNYGFHEAPNSYLAGHFCKLG